MDDEKKNLKEIILNQFPRYLFNFVFGIFVALLVPVLCNAPLKFLRTVNIDLASFIVGFIAIIAFLLWRSIKLGYAGNVSTYQFNFKRTMLYIEICIGLQILLTLYIGHAVYIEGPTYWLVNFILSNIDSAIDYRTPIYRICHWAFMLAADVLVYAPVMLYGEYRGAKEKRKESATQGEK